MYDKQYYIDSNIFSTYYITSNIEPENNKSRLRKVIREEYHIEDQIADTDKLIYSLLECINILYKGVSKDNIKRKDKEFIESILDKYNSNYNIVKYKRDIKETDSLLKPFNRHKKIVNLLKGDIDEG